MVQATDVRLSNPDTFVPGVPHDYFKYLRNNEPVKLEETDRGRFWILTKYDDIVHVSTHADIFSSAKGVNIEDRMTGAGTELMMLNMDAPRHTMLRNIVSKGFTPKMVRAMEPHVRDIATKIIDNVAQRGECDFVVDIAAELPLQVILEMLGVPPEDHHQILQWSNEMVGGEDPEYQTTDERAMSAAMEMFAYAGRLADERRAEPRDDLISVLIDAEVDGLKLTPMEFNVFFLLLAVAGNETTRNLTSGGMLTLLEHPDQRQKLIDDPSLIPSAVEEMLRWIAPVMYFRRTATQDTEIRGQPIKEGEKVTMHYIAANRDEDVFPNADTFDVAREPNNHLAFGGGGPHFCLGSSLARLEIRIIFEELLRRLPDMELAGPVARLRSNFISGIKHIPVTYTPEKA
jgi:cholest-4-en-3-one 26-monooxygenase